MVQQGQMQQWRRRRKYHGRLVVPAVPATVAFATATTLFLVALSFYSILSMMTAADGRDAMISTPAPLHALRPNKAVAFPSDEDEHFDLWRTKNSSRFHGCSNASIEFEKAESITEPDRYLMIATSGGLNQQRTGIVDAVVAARILNAVLVVPKLDQESFWQDASEFAEIFDLDWFISSLEEDVKIIGELPSSKFFSSPYAMRIPRKCSPSCYKTRVLPALLKKHVVKLTKYDYRLSNKLEPELQKLRCRVNYHALRFAEPIRHMAGTLVGRMREKSTHFIALHLRFEPDMLAFSGCYYGGGDKERAELGEIRKRWKALHTSDPEKQRRQGKCPLTPEEIGVLLRALGFDGDTHIYVASGETYGGEEMMAPLKAVFPNLHSKETLATHDELSPFSPFSSRMAALDFMVCDASDVFVTNNNGNMARMLAGRRRYYGHKRTVVPNAKKLSRLFPNRTSMSSEAFAARVRMAQRGFMGEPGTGRPGGGEFYENPRQCICEGTDVSSKKAGDGDDNDDRDMDWRDLDYGEHAPLDRDSSGDVWELEEDDPAKA